MTASYRKIDYRIRPAKSIERKMLAESFRKLSEFGKLSDYRYLGFGSLYFSDFTLFHKMLGLEHMISIEDATDRTIQDRFRMNVPYGHIEMKFGNSNTVMQTLDWDVRTICWLDYDGSLRTMCLTDIDYVTRKCLPGSMLLVSVNAGNIEQIAASDDEPAENLNLVDRLKQLVNPFAVPFNVKSSDLSGWGVADVYRRIITEAINEALRTRNRTLTLGAYVKYKPLYYFRYADNAKMVTVGGLLYDGGQEQLAARCCFEELNYIRMGSDPYTIDPPNLTYKEMRQIDAGRRRPMLELPLPLSDVERYEATYRFFPNFIEAEIG